MKKKIKDLTIIEASKICCSNSCNKCPLRFDKKETWCGADFAGIEIEKHFKHEIESEVEVDE